MSKAFLKTNTKKPYVKSSPLSLVLNLNQKNLTNKVSSKVKNTPSLIGFSTANTSEFPNDAKESSLSDIVEKIGRSHSPYYLKKDVLKALKKRIKSRGMSTPKIFLDTLNSQVR
jgi:hypothetical protein